MVVRVGNRAGEGYSRGYGVVVIVHQAYCRCKVRVTEKTVYLICLRDRNGGGGSDANGRIFHKSDLPVFKDTPLILRPDPFKPRLSARVSAEPNCCFRSLSSSSSSTTFSAVVSLPFPLSFHLPSELLVRSPPCLIQSTGLELAGDMEPWRFGRAAGSCCERDEAARPRAAKPLPF